MYRYVDIDYMRRVVLDNQVLLFSIIFEVPEPNRNYLSPFRIDNNPGCKFSVWNNKVYFVDWAEEKGKTHRDIFKFAKEYYNLQSFEDTVIFLYDLLSSNENLPKIDKKYRILQKQEKKSIDIKFGKRYFNFSDVKYWKQYGLSLKDLINPGNFKIFPIKWYEINNKIIFPKLSYVYQFDNRIKIYSPYSNMKWIGNVKGTQLGYTGKKHNKLIITKSVKDSLVLSKLGFDAVFGQSELLKPNLKSLLDTVSKYKEVKILYDNDNTGRNYGERMFYFMKYFFLSKKIDILFTPREKDISDFVKAYGLNAAYQILK